MTQQPTPTRAGASTATVIRAVISICETVAFLAASIMAALNNGQDTRHAIVTALVGFILHGVNHNAGGSPI